MLTIGSLGAFVGPLVYGNTTTGAGADTSYVQGHFAMFGVFGAALAAAMRLAFHERAADRRLVVRPDFARAARGCCCGAPDDDGNGDGDGKSNEGGDSALGASEGDALLTAKPTARPPAAAFKL